MKTRGGKVPRMTTLAEIKSAAERLPLDEKQELFLFLAANLRAQGALLPEPRRFSREEIDKWFEQDELDMADLREME